jgi:hypothetical protein
MNSLRHRIAPALAACFPALLLSSLSAFAAAAPAKYVVGYATHTARALNSEKGNHRGLPLHTRCLIAYGVCGEFIAVK